MKVDQEFRYYYGSQIKNYISQFSQVFSEMYVTTGKNDRERDNDYIRIPIVYGAMDKVVSAIKAGHTQNKPLRLPMFSIKLTNIALAIDRKSGTNTEFSKSVIPLGGDPIKDVKVLKRAKPLPYILTMNLTAYVSNTDHLFQIIEQIALLFDPTFQFQTSDVYCDWTKIIDATLTQINIDDRQIDTDGRVSLATFTFDVLGYMSLPATLKDESIKSIRIRINTDNFEDFMDIIN